MLRIQHISLIQFKNYPNRSFDFTRRIVGICGNNGVGKTNLLDAIHYLCFTRSYFSRVDHSSVLHGQSGFRIEGVVDREGETEKVVCILRENGRKEFSVNGEVYEKFSRHMGRYPCVVIAPDDGVLITGDSSERRYFMDTLLSQLDADYLQQLIVYKKVLEQRNSLLRSFAETGNRNAALLEVLDSQLLDPGTKIFLRRDAFIRRFLPIVRARYEEISGQPLESGTDKEVQLAYESDLQQGSFSDLLEANRSRDLFSQRTTCGIHRDEINIRLGRQPFKQIASQGQRKSLLFALKLAELELLQEEKQMPPLLLLDDIFEKLDEDRIGNLLRRIGNGYPGQVFITDTNPGRLEEHLGKWENEFQLIMVN